MSRVKFPRAQIGDQVYIEWFDAWYESQFDGSLDEAFERRARMHLERTGFFLEYREGMVLLTAELCPQQDGSRWLWAIPKVNITLMEITRKCPRSQKKQLTK